MVTYGPEAGKLCTIVDVLDQNRVLVDGPEPITGVKRQTINLKRIKLTDITVPAKLNSSQKCVPLPSMIRQPCRLAPVHACSPRRPCTDAPPQFRLLPAAACPPCVAHLLTTDPVFAARRTLKKLWADEGVQAKWEATNQFKKRSARALRASTTDFDRFKILIAKKERSAKRKAA